MWHLVTTNKAHIDWISDILRSYHWNLEWVCAPYAYFSKCCVCARVIWITQVAWVKIALINVSIKNIPVWNSNDARITISFSYISWWRHCKLCSAVVCWLARRNMTIISSSKLGEITFCPASILLSCLFTVTIWRRLGTTKSLFILILITMPLAIYFPKP